MRCQSQLSTIAEEGSLAERYCLVLEELRKEVVQPLEDRQVGGFEILAERFPRQIEPIQHKTDVVSGSMEYDFDPEGLADSAGFDYTSGSSGFELTGWGAFDSTVSWLCRYKVKTQAVSVLICFKVTSGFGNVEDILGTEFMKF